jgi:hypothetical protein
MSRLAITLLIGLAAATIDVLPILDHIRLRRYAHMRG